MALVLLFSAVAVWSLPAYAGEDLDALFIAIDLASGCTPRLVALDQGRVRYPGGDQQDVCPGFAVQAGGCPQVPGPVPRGADLPGRLVDRVPRQVVEYWSAPSPATARSRVRLAVLACLQAADGCQPAEPVIRDFVAFAAQLLGERYLAQACAGLPGVRDDAPGG